ncbi:MAG TPA: SDR family NAD(P)-dependent oxidoreductase [Gammaproteobacteria bacterium]|nr:SDR family NAD(P)-dependent oxidoreductase [Gammaproteobacteria bacterium]
MSKTQAMEQRVILVTGAGGAIGSAVAQALAAQGASVVLMGRSLPALEKTYDAITSAGHPQPAICPMDFASTTEYDLQNSAAMIDQEFKRLDGLLHCAATLGSLTPIEHFDTGTWNRVLQVNLTAPLLLTRACLPLLKAAPAASILFSTGDVGQRGRAYWGAYAVAQAGIENLTQILADELEANTRIRVNCIDPGPIRSRLRALAYPGEDPNTLPVAETVVPAYVHLLETAETGALNGQRIYARDYLKTLSRIS